MSIISENHSIVSASGITSGQRSVVRLRVEVDFNHLAPAARPQSFVYVPQITLPSVRMDAASDHLAVYDIEMVMWIIESGKR